MQREVGKDGKSLHMWLSRMDQMSSIGRNIPICGVAPQEVKQHATLDNYWCVLDGVVYNLTDFLDYHPGGKTARRGALP